MTGWMDGRRWNGLALSISGRRRGTSIMGWLAPSVILFVVPQKPPNPQTDASIVSFPRSLSRSVGGGRVQAAENNGTVVQVQ